MKVAKILNEQKFNEEGISCYLFDEETGEWVFSWFFPVVDNKVNTQIVGRMAELSVLGYTIQV